MREGREGFFSSVQEPCMNVVRSLSFLLLLFFLAQALLAQATLPESPALTEAPLQAPLWFIGLEGGVQGVVSSGSFTAPCNCTYESGAMLVSPVSGLFVEHVVAPAWRVEAGVRFSMYNVNYSENGTLIRYASDGGELRLEIERKASVRISYLSLYADAKWYAGLSGLYFSVGPDIGVFVAGTFKDQETLLTPGYVYPQNRTNTYVYADGDFKQSYETSTLRIGARLAAGYDLMLSSSWTLTPEAAYLLGLTPVATGHSSWKLSGVQGMLRLKVAM
jgi:hypothetical protein